MPRDAVLLRPDQQTLAGTRNIRPDARVELWDWMGDATAGLDAQDTFERAHALPALLEGSPRIAWLSLPSRLAAQLKPRHLANVGVLHFSGEGVADLRGVDAPVSVTALGGYKVSFKLNGDSFPALQSLDLRLTKTARVGPVLSRFPRVRELLVSPARDEQLRALPPRLEALHLIHGALIDLDCIEHLTGLRLVQLNNLPKLRSVEALAALSGLEEVMLGYCPELDPAPLLRCPRLRFMTVIGVPSIGPFREELGKLFAARGGSAAL